jgi:hypothetical protein
VYVYAKDKAGNISVAAVGTSDEIIYDVTPPVVSGVTVKNGDPYTTEAAVTVGFALTDGSGGSGIASYVVSEASSAPDTGWVVCTSEQKTGSITLSEEGTRTVYVYAKDAAGNTSKVDANDTHDSIIYDKTPPSLDCTTNLPTATEASSPDLALHLTGTDLSGVTTIYYWEGTGSRATAQSNSLLFSKTISVAADAVSFSSGTLDEIGKVSFRFTLADAAGNETANGYQMTYYEGAGWTFDGSTGISPRSVFASMTGSLSRFSSSRNSVGPRTAARPLAMTGSGSVDSSSIAAALGESPADASETVFTPSAFEPSAVSSDSATRISYSGIAQTASFTPSTFSSFFPERAARAQSMIAETGAERRKNSSASPSLAVAERLTTASPIAMARPFGVSAADFGASRLAWLLSGGAQGRPSNRSPSRPLRDSGAEFERIACLPAAHAGRGGSSDDEGAGDEDSGELE